MFTENSGLVQVWVNLIKIGTYTEDRVPTLLNLRDIVHQELNKN